MTQRRALAATSFEGGRGVLFAATLFMVGIVPSAILIFYFARNKRTLRGSSILHRP
jgi:hypothetical protein